VTEPGSPGKKPAGAAKYAGLGVQLAAAILVFVFAGQWLDKKLGTQALFTILGAFLGFGGTMWSLIRRLNKDNKEEEAGKR
jgi:F0F1-type ATP synthase assembly protein I